MTQHYNNLVRDAVPAWIASLRPEFDALVKVVRSAARKLPPTLRANALDWTDPKVTAPWQRAEGAAIQLDQLVQDRQTMARAIGHDGGRDNALYTVAHFPEPTVEGVRAHRLREEFAPAIHGWKDLHAQPVSRWLHLVRAPGLTVDLATTPGEVVTRARTIGRWQAGAMALHEASGQAETQSRITRAITA